MEPINQRSARSFKVNALSEWILWIYQHEFSNLTRNFNTALKIEFIVSERVQVNPENSRAMNALTFWLVNLNTLQKLVKVSVSRSHGVMTVSVEFTPRLLLDVYLCKLHYNDTTAVAIVKIWRMWWIFFSHRKANIWHQNNVTSHHSDTKISVTFRLHLCM